MPIYEFQCNKCGEIKEERISFEEVKKLVDWPRYPCKCGGELVKQFSDPMIFSRRDVLKPLEISSHAEDWKKKRAAQTDIAIYEEGFESQSEMKESMDMAKEEEAKRESVKGSLTTGVEMPTTEEGKEAVKKRMAKKTDQSRKNRSRIV